MRGPDTLLRQPVSEANQGKRIELTPRGEALGRALREAVAEVEHEWARQLGRERREQLRALLTELCEIVQPVHERSAAQGEPGSRTGLAAEEHAQYRSVAGDAGSESFASSPSERRTT